MKNTIDTLDNFEIDRPHNAGKLYNFLINYKFQSVLNLLRLEIKDLNLFDLCCGSGMMSEFYANKGAQVTGIDLSAEAIERAKLRSKKYGFSANFSTGNATSVNFSENYFDFASVHDGLHHIPNPQKAISEMVRTAKKGIIIIEPYEAFITKIAVLLGFSQKYEEKDFVYRFNKQEIIHWLKELGIKEIIIKRFIMYYPHKPNILFKLLSCQPFFSLTKSIFYLSNALFGTFGNKVIVIGIK